MKKFLIGFASCLLVFGLCSYTYRVNNVDVNIRTITEENHKYVVSTISSPAGSNCGGIALVHSENCPCLKNK